jgi:hypothetical protein
MLLEERPMGLQEELGLDGMTSLTAEPWGELTALSSNSTGAVKIGRAHVW